MAKKHKITNRPKAHVNNNKERVLEQFFLYPTTELELREISRNIGLAPMSVRNYLDELLKEKLILKRLHRIRKYPLYLANYDSRFYKRRKRLWTVRMLYESGLVDFLNDIYLPSSIILFGSCARGEDDEESDIDIFIEAKRRGRYEIETELKPFDRFFKKKINPYFEPDINDVRSGLRTNIVNGTILQGFVDINYGKKTKRASGPSKDKTDNPFGREGPRSDRRKRS